MQTYFFNNRLDEYREILSSAIDRGYKIISLRDWVSAEIRSTDKILVLRHDIDEHSDATEKMLNIEISLGARASYYFRHCTANSELITKIEAHGSEASLHYESIADYLIQNSDIASKEEFLKREGLEKCTEILKCQLNIFRLLYNVEAVTIASHGHKINRNLGLPNNLITENIAVYENLKIKLESYNEIFVNSLSAYISDCPIEINQGYRYGLSPLSALAQEKQVILFLTHPNHWSYTLLHRVKKIAKIILLGRVNRPEFFNRI
jgi:hypothetical protein